MSWNYRVIETLTDGEKFFAIHEVYYDGDKPVGMTMSPVNLTWNEGDDAALILSRMALALTKPVLKESDLVNRQS